jgi:hypothetical protein
MIHTLIKLPILINLYYKLTFVNIIHLVLLITTINIFNEFWFIQHSQ